MPITRPSTQEDADNRLREAFIIQDFGALGGEVESYPLPDRNALLYSSATSAWAERILGAPANPYHPGWQGQKDGIVRSYFGEREAKDVSDEDLFGKIATDYRAQEKIANAARIAAARGESWLGKFREVETQEAGSIIPGRMTNYLGLARAAHDEMAAKVNPYRNTIKAVADMARNIDTSAEGMDWGAMASELVKIPKEDRPYVLEALSLQTPGESKAGDAERIKTAFVRGMERYLDTAVSSLETAGESTAGEFLRQSYGFDVEAQTPEQKAQRADFLDLRDDMRDIATGKLAPLKAVKIAGMNIAGAAEMLPMTLGSFVPYVGAAVTLGSFQRSTYNDIRRSNPEMSRDSANAIATVSAPFQAITEIASDRFLFGRLPNLKRAFTQPIFSATGALGMFATRAAIGTATEVSEEFIQGVTPLAIQDLSKALGQDLPGSDWNGFLGEFAQSLPELISTILPLAIVGAGTGQLSDFRAGRQLARSPDMLIAAQYSPESAAKISELANAGKWSEAEDAIRLDWAKINAKGADMAQVKATAEQRIQAAERIKSLQREQVSAEGLQTTSPDFTASVTRSPTGWQVTTGEGTIIPVDSAEAANQIYSKLRQVGSQQEADALVSVIDGYYEQGRQAETVFTGETVQASDVEAVGVVATRRDAGGAILSQRQLGPQALETVRAEAEVAGIKSGTQGIFAHINGSNEVFPMRVANGAKEIFRRMNLYKSQAEGQPQVITFLHENFESTWRLGMENGTFSDQETRTAMRALLPAFEGVTTLNAEEAQFIDNLRTLASGKGNETMLRETVSEMVIRDVLGRDRQGLATGMKPGSISRAIEASVMGANTQEEVSALKSILAAIKAFTAYLKGVFGTVDAITKARDEGKLGEEYDTFINKVLGIDEVKQMEGQAIDEAKAMLGVDEEAQAVIDAGNMAFSIAPLRAFTTKAEKEYAFGDGRYTHPVTLTNGTRLSGETFDYKWGSKIEIGKAGGIPTFFGYTKNGDEITIQARDVRPDMVASSRDNNRSANDLRDRLMMWHNKAKEQGFNFLDAGNMAFSISPVTPEQDAEYLAAVESAIETFSDLSPKQAENLRDLLEAEGWAIEYEGSNGALVYTSAEDLQERGIPRAVIYADFSSQADPQSLEDAIDYLIAGGFIDGDSRKVAESYWSKVVPVVPSKNAITGLDYIAESDKGPFPVQARDLASKYQLTPDQQRQLVEARSMVAFEVLKKDLIASADMVPIKRVGSMAELRALVEASYPSMPAEHVRAAVEKAWQRNQGDYSFLEGNDFNIANAVVRPYARHNFTNYDSIIRRAGGKSDAREATFDEVEGLLSEWHANPARFSISPIRNLNELSDQVERNFAENPAGALEVKSKVIRQFAKLADKWSNERWTPQGNKIRPISEKRTVKSLDKEQAMRQAQREVELVNEGMDKLTPNTIMAYSEGVGTLEDDPLVKKMLHDNGKLMSKATAERESRNIKDQYEDAGWIPPSWYSGGTTITTVIVTRADGSNESYDARKVPDEVKSEISNGAAKAVIKKHRTPATGGIMPDVMANNLGFDYASEMWAALESSIKSHRNAKADYAKAEAAVKAVEKAAFEQARQEAQAWRDETDAMQKEDWSPRESLVRDLITLEAIVAMFPQEIRGKIGGFVTLARKASEAARLKVLQRQLERGQELLEKHLKEQYGTAVDKLLERYQSKRDSSGRISGKILSTATEQVDYAAEFIDLDIVSQAKEQAALEKQVEESESAEEVQDALTKLGIARLFEVWDTKDSASRESAFLWLNETIEQGKQGKKLLDEERKAFLDDMRQSGQASILQGDELNAAVADNLTNLNKGVMRRALLGMRGVLSESLWTTLQRLELIFGEDSKILDYFSSKIINAANLSTDIKRMVEAQKKEALSIIFNSDSKFQHARGIAELQKLKDSGIMISKVTKKEIKLDIDTLTKLADGTMDAKTAGLEQAEVDAALEEFAANARKRTVTIEKVTSRAAPTSRTMSETQGIQWWLWSMQDASRKQMERDGWDADSFAQLEKFLSPEAKALGRWISGSYQDAAGMIDPIYRRLFNAPLPRIKNYSPIYRRNMNAGGEVMDLDSSDMNSGLAAGFTKSRVNTTASLVESDALAVFLAHWENVSHWVAHAEMMRDMKAILLDKDTAVAIRQKKSEGYLQRLKQDISTIEKNGTNNANELVNMSRFWRWLMQYRAYKGLAFRISPIIKQTPALLNPLLADVPAHNYMMGLSRAFIEPQAFASEVSAMWKSDIIRRRIESGFSAESRVAMQGSSMTGSQAILAMQAGMMPMGMVDGGWTALGAAISFDYYRRGYMRENPQMTPEIADAKAIARVEKMIATSAQPSDVYARALYERNGNAFMRSMSMFVSDQRKALAIELMAIRKLATGKSKNKSLDVQRAFVAHIVQAAVSQVMAGVIASLLGDDEDRDREWSTDQWTLALTLGPVNGLFVAGRLIDKGLRSILGLRVFPSDNLADKAFVDIWRAGKNIDDIFSDDPEDVINEIDNLSAAAGAGLSAAFGPAAGAVDVGANVLREARKIQDRLSE